MPVALLAGPVKLVYCSACHNVAMRSRLERNVCERCQGPTQVIPVPYAWQYAAGVGIILAGAAFLLLPQVVAGIPWSDLTDGLGKRIAWLIGFLALGLYFSSWGIRAMKARVLELGRERHAEGRA